MNQLIFYFDESEDAIQKNVNYIRTWPNAHDQDFLFDLRFSSKFFISYNDQVIPFLSPSFLEWISNIALRVFMSIPMDLAMNTIIDDTIQFNAYPWHFPEFHLDIFNNIKPNSSPFFDMIINYYDFLEQTKKVFSVIKKILENAKNLSIFQLQQFKILKIIEPLLNSNYFSTLHERSESQFQMDLSNSNPIVQEIGKIYFYNINNVIH